MAITGNLFVFNPNTEPATQEININFQILEACTRLLGGGVFSPAEITSDQDNFTTLNTEGSLTGILRLSSDMSRNISGLADGQDGRMLCIINVGSNDIVLEDQEASSTAINRIITGTGADLTVEADDVVKLLYDGTTERWRVLSFSDALWG